MTRPGAAFLDDADTRLMVEFAAGDEAAFDRIVERFQRRVYGVVYRYVGNSAVADDCAQEVFLRLFRMRKSYRPTASLKTLIYRITTNLCLNLIRDERRRRMVSLDGASEKEGLPIKSVLKDEKAGEAWDRIAATERARIVRKALDEIPPRQRLALVLHKFEGLSYAKIAEAMETNVAAVKSLLNRARTSLAEALRPEIEAGNL